LNSPVQLGRERLVVGHDDGRPLHALDDVRDAERLAATRDTQQGLASEAVLQAFDQARDRLGLVPRGAVAGLQLERTGNVGHRYLPPIGIVCLGRP
jgi:hypothetical protein